MSLYWTLNFCVSCYDIFIDVRIFHPNAPSYIHKNLNQVYLEHEREKKRTYNDRILNIDKGTFTPLVFSTAGGMGKESEAYHRRLAQLIADKRRESYSHVISFIRTRIRFSLLKSTLISVRGVRGKTSHKPDPISSISFNMIPQEAEEY